MAPMTPVLESVQRLCLQCQLTEKIPGILKLVLYKTFCL